MLSFTAGWTKTYVASNESGDTVACPCKPGKLKSWPDLEERAIHFSSMNNDKKCDLAPQDVRNRSRSSTSVFFAFRGLIASAARLTGVNSLRILLDASAT